jgi:hypothetical protein
MKDHLVKRVMGWTKLLLKGLFSEGTNYGIKLL